MVSDLAVGHQGNVSVIRMTVLMLRRMRRILETMKIMRMRAMMRMM